MDKNETLEMQALKAFVAEKCREALAPLYKELEEIKASYQELKDEPTQQQTEPTPTPEDVEDAHYQAIWAQVKKELQAKGKLPKDN